MKRRWYIAGTAVLAAADQIMKSYVEQNLDKGAEKRLAEHVVLRRVENKGLCLNLLSGKKNAVKGLSGTAAAVVTVMQLGALARRKGVWSKTGFSLLTAGAWSNTFDRFFRGYVVDYIGFRCENKKVSDVTYNLGDFLIAAGVLMVSVRALFTPGKDRKKVTDVRKQQKE